MITLNNYEISVSHFPDGTQCIKFPVHCTYPVNTICWFYDSDEELFTLASVVDYVKRTEKLIRPYYTEKKKEEN